MAGNRIDRLPAMRFLGRFVAETGQIARDCGGAVLDFRRSL